MSRGLHISDSLNLPLAAVTEKLAFLGRTGSGKTYAAIKIAEEMYRAEAQFVAIDPVGVWYGLRLAPDGKASAFPIPVLGGLHGDIPLEPGSGAIIANLVVDRGISMVLDVSQFESDADKARFARDFADRFFFRKKAAPSAIHLFIEECQEFVPQNPQRDDARMLHAFTRLVKIGRNFGIGVSLISQRPQEVNKKVLNLTELLFAFQLTGPQERKTIQGWIAEKGIDEDIAGELPKLAQGEPHVWSPAWLRISKRVRIGQRVTFDASSTPTVGGKATPRHLSSIDLERLRTDMAATIEKAKAEDPRELRRRIAELELTLKRSQGVVAATAPAKEKRVEVPIFKDGHVKRIEATVHAVEGVSERTLKALGEAVTAANEMLRAVQKVAAVPPDAPRHPAAGVFSHGRFVPANAEATRRAATRHVAAGPGDPAITGGLRRMMIALAQRMPLNRGQLGIRAGVSPKGGSFDTYLSRARTAGWIDGRGEFVITPEGLKALGHYEPLPEGSALLAYWLNKFGGGARRMLQVLAEAYPKALSREQLGTAAEVSPDGGSFDTYLSRLRTLELIEGRGEFKASAELFD